MKKGFIHKRDGVPVVLGGGASRGPGLLGLVDVLNEARVLRSGYLGVSIGSIVATLLMNGFTTEQIAEFFATWLKKMWGLGGVLRALFPPIFDPVRFVGGGVLDLVPIMEDFVREYELKPAADILGYDLRSREAVVFKGGEDYPLARVLAGACAVPGLMRPVSLKHNGRSMLVADGGIWHPHPGALCDKPAVIGKLIYPTGMGLVYPDRDCDFVVEVGMPFAPFFTALSLEKVEELRQYGYSRARKALSLPLRRGLLPVAA